MHLFFLWTDLNAIFLDLKYYKPFDLNTLHIHRPCVQNCNILSVYGATYIVLVPSSKVLPTVDLSLMRSSLSNAALFYLIFGSEERKPDEHFDPVKSISPVDLSPVDRGLWKLRSL